MESDAKSFTLGELYVAWIEASVLHPDESPLHEDIVKILKNKRE